MAIADDTRATDAPSRRVSRVAKLRAKAFRAARRHTIYVKTLRFLLPLGIVGVLGGYGAFLYAKAGIKIGDGKATVEGIQVTSEDLKMKGVKYTGVAKDGSSYKVHARDALVDIAQTGPMRLTGIEGDLVQPNGVITKLKSRAGTVDNKKGEMDLMDGVDIVSSNGLQATMKSAKVFQKENRVIANEGVIATMPTGRIFADRMDLETKNKVGKFEGNVAVRLVQEQAGAKPLLGLGKETRAPVEVKSARLDIDDTKRFANFSGGVTAVQGENTLKSATMHLTYEGRPTTPGAPPPTDLMADSSGAKPKKLVATGGVSITSGIDRRVLSDSVEFDVPADLATFTGSAVEVQQGKNRLLGRRLIVDRKTGKTALDAPGEGRTPAGRIQTTFYQQQADGKAAPKPKAATPADGSAGGVMSFKTDPNAPMDVASVRLDVNDAAKQAIYTGAVRAQQGEFVLESAELIATYTGDTGLMAPAETATPGKAAVPATMSKVEAKGKVFITSREGQTLRGEWAIFDVKANTVLVGGPVTVKQGVNEITGPQMRIDMTTGEARFDEQKGAPRLAPALPPITPGKSAPGPGGLPGIGGPAAPTVSTTPPATTTRPSLTFFPSTVKDLKKPGSTDGAAKTPVPKAATPADAAAAKPAAPTKPKSDGWTPSTNSTASPAYRAP